MSSALAEIDTADSLIAEIRRLQFEVGENLWRMGRYLARLREREDWWKPKYERWDAFTRAELNLTGGYAYKLIDVAKNFTEKQVRECGATKLVRILPVPPEERARFIKQSRTSSSLELRASINRFTMDRAAGTPAGVLPTRITGRKAQRRSRKILHLDAAEQLVALYASKGDRRAKSIDDRPIGRLVLAGKAYLFAVRATEQGLVLAVKLEPEEP